MSRLARYRKALVAVVGAGLTWATATLPPDNRWWQLASALLAAGTAAGVFGVENAKPPTRLGLNLPPGPRPPQR